MLFSPCFDERLNSKCFLISQYFGIPLQIDASSNECRFPRLVDGNNNGRLIIGANSICKYLSLKCKVLPSQSATSSSSGSSGNKLNEEVINEILDVEEVEIYPLISSYVNVQSISGKSTRLIFYCDPPCS